MKRQPSPPCDSRIINIMCRWFFGMVLIIWASCANAGGLSISSQAQWPLAVPGNQVLVFEDPTGQMSPQSVAALPVGAGGFEPQVHAGTQPALSHSAWWARMDLASADPAPLPLRLVLGPNHFDQLDFYVETNGQWRHYAAGIARPLSAHTQASRLPVLALTLPPRENARILVRIQSTQAMLLHPRIYSESAFETSQQRNLLWDGLLFGGLLALGWSALTVALLARNATFTLLGAVSLVTTLYEASTRGYAKFHLWPESVEWSVRANSTLAYACLALFVLFLLNLSRDAGIRLPGRRFFIALGSLQAGLAAVAALGSPQAAQQISVYSTPIFGASVLVAAVVLFKRHAPTRGLMLVIAAFALIQYTLRAVEKLGLMPDFVYEAGTYSALNNPVLALLALYFNLTIIAVWIYQVGKQRNAARDMLTVWQERQQRHLKDEVDRQTMALNQALKYADEKNRQKTEILSYVGHDLRAPLATIVGYAQLLNESATPAQASHLRAIERSADYQLTLIDELLSYTSTELKPLALSPAPTRTTDLIDDIAQYAIALCRSQDNRFLCNALSPLPATVLLDSKRVRQVLLNLLSNAAKFTHNGTIRLNIDAQRSGDNWSLRFAVTDSGAGISAADRTSLFKAFEHAQPSQGSGTGLGLFIAQSLVRGMGGELHLDSEPGMGSRFHFGIEVASVGVDTVTWTAPAGETPHAATADEDQCLDIPTPPAHARMELAVMARDGLLTDIENWLTRAAAVYPDCLFFFGEIKKALQILDFEKIENLALSGG